MAPGKKLSIIKGQLVGTQANFGGESIEVPFNPTEYSIDKTNVFPEAGIPGLDSPLLQYSRGNSRVLSLELLLDTYGGQSQIDVRKKYVEKLENLMAIDKDMHAPPPCKVVWGSLEFVGFLENMTRKFTLFLNDGTPVRARVTLKFKEYIPVEIQTKSVPRQSPDRRKSHRLQEGESLWQLAYRSYGDAACWRVIAEANDIDNPLALQVGKTLVIPPLERTAEVPLGAE
jgi:hypothetical protein